jgi:hypothetical protein
MWVHPKAQVEGHPIRRLGRRGRLANALHRSAFSIDGLRLILIRLVGPQRSPSSSSVDLRHKPSVSVNRACPLSGLHVGKRLAPAQVSCPWFHVYRCDRAGAQI